ncbi:MAG TPA: dihydroxyacetone kinase phosphoryl donor subunit DhaM [Ktedonobacteraceae bacterium]|nr:dihydroxyacetone kinase phosphoryl donor subunit DhaM [Ktedonobacteraceae bacterium]
MTVSLVVVSHSAKLAEGVAELAGQMTQGKIAIAAAGGTPEGELGTSVERIIAALKQVAGPEGTLILLDLGSAVMSAEMAVEQFSLESDFKVTISPGPLVEGAIIAAVEASVGNSLEEVALAAQQAMTLPKLQSLN